MLIVFCGLPGTGKSSVARPLAERMRAAYLRVDSVEAALKNAGIERVTVEGYAALYAVAADQLRIGLSAVVDVVNPLAVTRDAWADVARQMGVALVNVEVVCSDPAEHRRRVEARRDDLGTHAGRWTPPTWLEVQETAAMYEAWASPVLHLDTAGRTPEELLALVQAHLRTLA